MSGLLSSIEDRPSQGEYGALFETFIAGSLQTSLARVQACANLPADADRRQAWHALSYALQVGALWPLTRELLLSLAPKMEQAGFREEWLAFLTRGLAEARVHDDRHAQAELGCHAGMIYRYLSRYDEAHAVLAECAGVAAQLAMPSQRAQILNQLAYVEYERARYAIAKQYAEEVLKIEGLPEAEEATAKGLLGLLAHENERYEEAIKLHQEALGIRRLMADQRAIAWSLQNIGYALRRQGQVDRAIVHFVEALRLLETVGDDYHYALMLNNLGGSYAEAKQPKSAITVLVEARAIFQRLGAAKWLAATNLNLGLSYLAQGEADKAADAFDSAVEQFAKVKSIGEELNARDGLALAYMKKGDYTGAETVLERAMTKLPLIADIPFHYNYLSKVLPEHLAQARRGKVTAYPAELELS